MIRLHPARPTLIISDGDNDTMLRGTRLDDRIISGEGSDTILSLRGNDLIIAGGGCDALNGGIGRDTMFGGAGSDLLLGRSGHDRLYGGADGDLLNGGFGDDRLYGGNGCDTLNGGNGPGNDLLNGGNGADTFLFDWDSGKLSRSGDRITDLSLSDTIAVDVDAPGAFDFIADGTFDELTTPRATPAFIRIDGTLWFAQAGDLDFRLLAQIGDAALSVDQLVLL